MDLWWVVGLLECGTGAILFVRPAMGRSLFAIEYHDRAAERFPRVYRSWGWRMLRNNVEFFTKLVGAFLIVLGIATAIISLV